MRLGFLLAITVFIPLLMAGCDTAQPIKPIQEQAQASVSAQPDWSRMSGALVSLGMESSVGVLLDDVPPEHRDRLAAVLFAKPESFWQQRAKRQLNLTSLRLSFRNGFYPKGTKWQLPLPPEEQWSITLKGEPQRTTIDGHDVVAVSYVFGGMLLTNIDSPGRSEPKLQEIGGVWDEPFIFPVDPEFIFQRTGLACFNEGQFPPNSVDAEEADLFYDHGCTVEKKLSDTGCHQTEMPKQSCVQALKGSIGSVKTSMRFERLPWNARTADRIRLGVITNPNGPDLEPSAEKFRQHRFTYRYIPNNSCTLEEKCVGGYGWRKLLMFPTADINSGAKPLDIGLVDYFQTEGGSVLSEHGMFEFSACHDHYHFSHYGTFSLGDGSEAITRKNGFCMQPTARLANHELSPLDHRYVDCIDQGVSVGWIDEYKMGLECQWIDVTSVAPAQMLPLSFTTNPDGLLCEGVLKRDAQGNQLFAESEFRTSTGKPVDRPQCETYPGWFANNTDAYDVRIPDTGESYITAACDEGHFGGLRNCGLRNVKTLFECRPGTIVRLRCSVPSGAYPQVLRICEGSRALQSGIPCTYNDAVASAIIGTTKDISFACPSGRDDSETGGAYSYLTGPLLPEDAPAQVTCVPQP